MPTTKLDAAAVGLPSFDLPTIPDDGAPVDVFRLSSHARARDALDFGLKSRDTGFNIFVVGENRSGRMTTTLNYLRSHFKDGTKPNDWVYLNNFRHPSEPIAVHLPAGVGRSFRDAMADLIPNIRQALSVAFAREEYRQRIRQEEDAMRGAIRTRIEAIRGEAEAAGLSLVQAPQGMAVMLLDEKGQPRDAHELPDTERQAVEAAAKQASEKLAEVNREAARRQAEFNRRMREFSREVAASAISDLLDAFAGGFAEHQALNRWLVAFRVDILENLSLFSRPAGGAEDTPDRPMPSPEERYAVNLFVDNGDLDQPPVIVEANPTYANLFGRIEYRQVGGMLQTDFSLVRPGALHRANGGILVLRAEAIAAALDSWAQLKGALRDREIKVEELHRVGGVPIAGAPQPQPIPLDVKVMIVGAPDWYYAFFSIDPEFQTYFKVKAEIDPDMHATPDNLSCYARLIQHFAQEHAGAPCEGDAVRHLLGYASRLAADREKLSARFELIEDIVSEAVIEGGGGRGQPVTRDAVVAARRNRRNRNARIEDRTQEAITRGTVMIDTVGEVVGQINGLTVRDLGDHSFGAPARVTARTSIGRRGVTNIERETLLGGPIQQKGAMVIQGFLAGLFAQRQPMSFNASITFEQSYGGVEGDSASLAELLAILSDLSGVPLRQDLAVTGSVNQLGEVQAIGGLTQKAEGFYRTCLAAGGLTGDQGVVCPAANAVHLVLDEEPAKAVADGSFHIYAVDDIAAALELFTGQQAGTVDADGAYSPDSIYGRIAARLVEFDRILDEREQHID